MMGRQLLHSLLGLGQHFETLKSDSHAELSFLQFFLHPKNLPEAPRPLTLCLNGVFGHAIFVGLPIAWFARRSASKN